MVSPALRSTIDAMSVDDRCALADYVESTIDRVPAGLTAAQLAEVRRRDAEMDANPSLALTWEQIDAKMADLWG